MARSGDLPAMLDALTASTSHHRDEVEEWKRSCREIEMGGGENRKKRLSMKHKGLRSSLQPKCSTLSACTLPGYEHSAAAGERRARTL